MRRILNLTQHSATADQAAEGVVDLPGYEREQAMELLNFAECPDAADIADRVHDLALLASMSDAWGEAGPPADARVMIGGALWLMAPLAAELLHTHRLQPVFAFSRRESLDQPQQDGTVRKTVVFRHAGWVPAA